MAWAYKELAPAEGRVTDSLGVRLFRTRLDLIGELDERAPTQNRARSSESSLPYPEGATEADVRRVIAQRLHHEVESMNVDNFVEPLRLPRSEAADGARLDKTIFVDLY